MTIFAILMPSAQPLLIDKIKTVFPENHFAVNATQWLISATGTAADISSKLGIFQPGNPQATPTGSAIVFATSSYHGRAPTNVWDWIKVKLEASPGG